MQSKSLIHLIQVVHEIVITNHFAKMAAAAAYQSIVGAERKRQAGGAQKYVGWVQHVGQYASATP